MWATFMYLCRHVNVIRRPVNVCHGFVPSCFRYFCHSNVFHAHACHAIMCHAIVTSCKCLSCKRGHVNERPTSASSCVPRWLPLKSLRRSKRHVTRNLADLPLLGQHEHPSKRPHPLLSRQVEAITITFVITKLQPA